MAENERLGASFSIDITNLRAGLTQANKLIRESESEFKAAAAGMDDWRESEEGLNAKIKSLTGVTEIQQKKVDALKEEYKRLIDDGLDPASTQAVELRTKINNEQAALNKNKAELEKQEKALNEMREASEDAGEAVEDTGEAAKESSEGFTVAKGAIANLISSGLEAMVGACKNAISSLMNLAEETQEYREDIGKLETAFESAGKSTELATAMYKEFYSVLGEEDRSVEAVNHLAKFVETEEDMAKWTDICAGVVGTFGDSLPIESLTESANETAKVSKITGTLADALVWAGINEDDFNKSLEACNDESERASLITETLNDLYSDAAGHYRENNASVIEARKATSDYTDTLAEMGEKMQPVSTAISNIKNQFLKGLTPVLEDDVIPLFDDFFETIEKDKTVEKFSKSVANLAKSILPPLSKALKFLAENFETIIKVTYTAVTAYAAFNAALKVTTAIKAASTAMKALTTATSAATVAQTGLNAVMAANPIGAVLTAVGLLVGGLTLLTGANEEAEETTEDLTEAQEDAVTVALETADAYKEAREEAAKLASQETANVDYLKGTLLPELQNLVDANGNVKEGYEARARANFILNELNTALGTEYASLSEIIGANGQIEQSVYDIIEAKKAQILLEAYEDSYREAIIEVTNAEMARAEQAQKVAEAQRELQEADAETQEKFEALRDAVLDGNMLLVGSYDSEYQAAKANSDGKKAALDEQMAKYNESDLNLQTYYNNINAYEQASTLVTQGETDKAISYLQNLGTQYSTTASAAQLSADDQVAALEQQVIDSEVNLQLLKDDYEKTQGDMTEEEKIQAQARIDNAKTKAEEAKEEFKKVGGEITEGIANGSEEKSWFLNTKMGTLISNAIAAARAAADAHSPSRKFKKLVGVPIGEGIAVGIDDSTKTVVKSIQKQSQAMQDAYDLAGLSNSVDIGLNAGTGSGASATQKSGVVVYQTNNYSQAHSRYELYKTKQQTAAAVRLAVQGV